MLAIEPHESLIPAILLLIGLALFVGTLVSVWQNRDDAITRRAASKSVLISISSGFLVLIYWAILLDEPAFPLAVATILLVVIMPMFVIVYYLSSAWFRRSNAADDQT